MNRLSPLVLFAILAGCTTDFLYTAKAKPTAAFPRSWSGEMLREPAPAPSPQPVARVERAAPPAEPARVERAAAAEAGLVAVLPLDLREASIDSAAGVALEEALRAVTADALSPLGYTVLTNETTLAVLEANGVDAQKACEASCALSAARELKARLFVAGTVVRTDGEFLAFVRLFETAQGRQLGSLQLEGASARDIRRSFQARAPAFFEQAVGRR